MVSRHSVVVNVLDFINIIVSTLVIVLISDKHTGER